MASTPHTGNIAHVQYVDQQGLPYDGSPNGTIHDDLCDWLTVMGRLDTDALNTL